MAQGGADSDASRDERGLVSYATSTPDDLYSLLQLDPDVYTSSSETELLSALNKAWRQTAKRHHPDRNRGQEVEAAARYDQARKAFEVLSNPAAKAAFDSKRAAQQAKRERDQKFQGRRKELKEDLERREREAAAARAGTKRTAFSAGMNGADEYRYNSNGTEANDKLRKRQADIDRIATETRRRRAEKREEQIKERAQEAQLAEKEEQDIERAKQKRENGDLADLDAREQEILARREALAAAKKHKKEKHKHKEKNMSLEEREMGVETIAASKTPFSDAILQNSQTADIKSGQDGDNIGGPLQGPGVGAAGTGAGLGSGKSDRLAKLLERCREAEAAKRARSSMATAEV